MVIIDTSIWIEFFRGNDAYFEHVSELLESSHVYSTEPIFSELLQGAKNSRELNIIAQYWENINKYPEKGLWIKAGIISSKNKYTSQGVGIIDAMILAYAKKYKLKVWTLDKKLLKILGNDSIYNM